VTRLWARRPGFSSRQGRVSFSIGHSIQTGSVAHPASYPMNTGGSFPGGKVTGSWSWPLTTIWCWMRGAIPPPPYVLTVWCLITRTAWCLPLVPYKYRPVTSLNSLRCMCQQNSVKKGREVALLQHFVMLLPRILFLYLSHSSGMGWVQSSAITRLSQVASLILRFGRHQPTHRYIKRSWMRAI
jgi:hypothetical protein